MKYEQSLYKIIEPIRINTIKRLNKSKKWEYGYNKENDVVVISKTGMIGDVVEIQGLKIALPKQPKEIYSCSKIKSEQNGNAFQISLSLKKLKQFLTGKIILLILKKNTTVIQMKSLKEEKKAFGL